MTATPISVLRRRLVLGVAFLLAASAAAAQPADQAAALPLVAPAPQASDQPAAQRLGPETNLPLPRFVSLNVETANIRRGPGVAHRVDWVFKRRGLPLEVIAEHGHWRRVRDVDDAGGWVHHSLLRGARTAVVIAGPDAALRADPAPDARPVARAETGVIGQIDRCLPLWCRFAADGRRGWVQKADLWGVRPEEVFD
jgi:SH3-like domain-containing protein